MLLKSSNEHGNSKWQVITSVNTYCTKKLDSGVQIGVYVGMDWSKKHRMNIVFFSNYNIVFAKRLLLLKYIR